MPKIAYVSDGERFSGKVIKKFIDGDGESCIEIEAHAINQRNEDGIPRLSHRGERDLAKHDHRVFKKEIKLFRLNPSILSRS